MCKMATPSNMTTAENTIYDISNIVKEVFTETESISHGVVTLEVHVRDGRPVRAVVSRSRSLLIEGVKA